MAIPLALVYFAYRRPNVPFRHLFWLFGAFIVGCGFTHFFQVVTSFHPIYRFSGLVNLATAVVSWVTVVALLKVVPRAFSMRFPEELELEVTERRRAEEEIRRLNENLEQHVTQRTEEVQTRNEELVKANEALQTEITKRSQVEEALRESEARKGAILESALDCIITIDDSGRILDFNPAAEQTFGYRPAQVFGRDMAEVIIPPSLREQHRRGLAHYLATGDGPVLGKRIEMPALHAKGHEFPVELAISVIQVKGRPMFTAYLRDITERRATQEELQKTNSELLQLTLALEERVTQRTAEVEAKSEELRAMTQQLWQTAKLVTVGELTASIAHELNNPLATVSLRVESLLEHFREEETTRHVLEIIEHEVERMGNLVANLLQFSRRAAPQISTFDVREELDNTLELIHYHLRQRSIQVAREFAEDVPMIPADRQQLRQLFLNLFTNASDAMAQGGTLTVSVECRVTSDESTDSQPSLDTRHLSLVTITVADTGAGIAPQDLARVTEPFFTTKEEGKGTGLGLAICKRIVEEHRGTLTIASEVGADGLRPTGTRITITLPSRNGTNGKALRDTSEER